jgi:hypothetical protein
MNRPDRIGKITAADKFNARLLRLAPWLAFLLIAMPAPLYFLLRYFTTAEDAGVYMLLCLSSLAIGSIAGLLVAIFILVYRNRWKKNLRDRLAADGVTTDELDWFMPELTSAERAALKQLEAGSDALLADAYRETLASRITATRVATSAKRSLLQVDRRLNRATLQQGANTETLQSELQADRTRLERIRLAGDTSRAEAETRLQMIEAAASRGASFAETDFALKRLDAQRDQLPIALQAAQLELAAREDVEN